MVNRADAPKHRVPVSRRKLESEPVDCAGEFWRKIGPWVLARGEQHLRPGANQQRGDMPADEPTTAKDEVAPAPLAPKIL